MDEDKSTHIRQRIANKRKRLELLEIREAQEGIDTPPGIIIQIDNLRKEIEALEGQVEHWDQEASAGSVSQAPTGWRPERKGDLDQEQGGDRVAATTQTETRPAKKNIVTTPSWTARLSRYWSTLAIAAVVGLVLIVGGVFASHFAARSPGAGTSGPSTSIGATSSTLPPTAPSLSSTVFPIPTDGATPSRQVRVGIARFEDCQPPLELEDAIGLGADTATFEPLDAIQDQDTARSYTETQDLVIWGQCLSPGELMIHAEILTERGPYGLIELEQVTSRTSALDLEHAGRWSRAVINYLYGDADVAGSLAGLQEEAQNQAERAELAFLQGNSLLLSMNYEDAITAYEPALADARLQAQARNNRGLAGANWSLQLARDEPPDLDKSQAVIETAREELTTATQADGDPPFKAVAYSNLAAAYTLVEPLDYTYTQAFESCDAAIKHAPDHSLGYICRAAVRYLRLDETISVCNPQPNTRDARDDLATAQRLATSQGQDALLADIFYWRGRLSYLQSLCDSEQDKIAHEQAAKADFREFLARAGQRIRLTIEQDMEQTIPLPLD